MKDVHAAGMWRAEKSQVHLSVQWRNTNKGGPTSARVGDVGQVRCRGRQPEEFERARLRKRNVDEDKAKIVEESENTDKK